MGSGRGGSLAGGRRDSEWLERQRLIDKKRNSAPAVNMMMLIHRAAVRLAAVTAAQTQATLVGKAGEGGGWARVFRLRLGKAKFV